MGFAHLYQIDDGDSNLPKGINRDCVDQYSGICPIAFTSRHPENNAAEHQAHEDEEITAAKVYLHLVRFAVALLGCSAHMTNCAPAHGDEQEIIRSQ